MLPRSGSLQWETTVLEISLKGKNALITGSSKGIGRGCALAIAKAGGNVAVNHRASPDEAEEVAELVRREGGQAIVVQADVSDRLAVEEAVRKTVEAFGGLDLFVSNAVYSDRQPFLDADLEGFKRTIDVGMWGAFYGVRAAARQMREQGRGGSIAVISSPHAEIPFPTAMAYNMAKAAIDHMARTAATELYRYRIRVNVIHPGWIDTPGERKFFTEEQLAAGAASLPWKRLGNIDEVGMAVAYVLSDAADYMTGSTLTIDGGVKLPWWSKREEGGQ
jgi:glucose 1-dehydrogenase